jgi:hypothetical protein
MNPILGELRRTLVIGLAWGALWVTLTLVVGTLVQTLVPGQIDRGEEPIVLAPMIGLTGIVCGTLFAGLLLIVGWGRSRELPALAIVAWGLLVGVALPLAIGKDVGNAVVTAPVGALSALVSLGLLHRWTSGHLAPQRR